MPRNPEYRPPAGKSQPGSMKRKAWLVAERLQKWAAMTSRRSPTMPQHFATETEDADWLIKVNQAVTTEKKPAGCGAATNTSSSLPMPGRSVWFNDPVANRANGTTVQLAPRLARKRTL